MWKLFKRKLKHRKHLHLTKFLDFLSFSKIFSFSNFLTFARPYTLKSFKLFQSCFERSEFVPIGQKETLFYYMENLKKWLFSTLYYKPLQFHEKISIGQIDTLFYYMENLKNWLFSTLLLSMKSSAKLIHFSITCFLSKID